MLPGSPKRCLNNNNEMRQPKKHDHTKLDMEPRTSEGWARLTPKIIQSVVSIHFSTVSSFDTEGAYVSEATGFVVDSEKGIIMTNRHVVGPGPFVGYAVFDNHEECTLNAIYRDPVHDFGFLKFDPKEIKYMPVRALELRPELAQVGSEIRVIGNDAGEKLSILSGVISRVDRNAPDYGDMMYNDFNTEYIQAAASASGGSSGSPVVDYHGHVLALQAGGSASASTDFFLPLYRGKRALDCILAGKPISRGTILTQFLLKPYDECQRLGLSEEAEKAARQRNPDGTGLLVADMIIPEGPAANVIKEGDILVSLNGTYISSFRQMDEIYDDNVGKTVDFEVQRDGEIILEKVKIVDLHTLAPDRYVEFSGATFHDLSYQIARLYGLPVKGVYIAHTGIHFHINREKTGWLLLAINNKPVSNLDEFIEVVKMLPDKMLVPIKVVHVTDMHTIKTPIISIDRHWNKELRLAVRNDKTGLWDFQSLAPPLPCLPLPRQTGRYQAINIDGPGASSADLVRSFVKVESTVPFRVEGYSSSGVVENGVIVDAEKGYVLVSRYCVPHQLCDLHVTVAESVLVTAKVVFLHPQQNYAIIKYDPELVDADVLAVEFGTEKLKRGANLQFIGYNNHRILTTETKLTDITIVSIPQSHEFSPRYRSTNLESLGLDAPMIAECSSGILTDGDAKVRGLWLSFMGDVGADRHDRQFRLALDTADIGLVVKHLRETGSCDPKFVDAEFGATPVVYARINGVNEKWVRIVQEEHLRPQFFSVIRVSSSLGQYLEEGDILVAANGKLVSSLSQVMNLADSSIELTVVRHGREITLTVPTTKSSETLVDDFVCWSGILAHKPHHAVLQQIKQPPSYVYCVYVSNSSPAYVRGIGATQFITHVNGRSTQNIEEFHQVVSQLPDMKDIKVKFVSFDQIPMAGAIKTNYHYFPTWRIKMTNKSGVWQQEEELDDSDEGNQIVN